MMDARDLMPVWNLVPAAPRTGRPAALEVELAAFGDDPAPWARIHRGFATARRIAREDHNAWVQLCIVRGEGAPGPELAERLRGFDLIEEAGPLDPRGEPLAWPVGVGATGRIERRGRLKGLVLEVWGDCPPGSSDPAPALWISGALNVLTDIVRPRRAIVDATRLSYEWGDELDMLPAWFLFKRRGPVAWVLTQEQIAGGAFAYVLGKDAPVHASQDAAWAWLEAVHSGAAHDT